MFLQERFDAAKSYLVEDVLKVLRKVPAVRGGGTDVGRAPE